MKISMIYLRRLLAACLLIVAFAACNDDETSSSGSVSLLSDAEEVCLAKEEVVEIAISSTGDWAAVPSKGWLKLSTIQGTSGENQKIKVTVASNETFSQRIGTVVIKDKVSGKSVEVKITQGAKDAKFVFSEATTTLQINNEKREIVGQVKVTSNYDWSISIPEKDNWLTYQIGERDANSCTIRFYAEPDKMDNYNAREALVSFNYASATRTPVAETHQVLFDGIKPEVVFNRPYGETGVTDIRLEDMFGTGEYEATVIIKSNIAWSLKQIPDFVDVTILDGNKSAKFFETETNLILSLKADKLNTGDLEGGLQTFDAALNEPSSVLKIQLGGVGEHYVFIDPSTFKPESAMVPCFMFDASSEDGYSSILKNFFVRASNQAKVNFYLVKLQNSWGYPSKDAYNDYGILVSNDVTNRWGGVDPIETPMTRRPVEGKEWQLWLKSRDDFEGQLSNSKKDRFFALLAVSADLAPTYDDLFDTEGNLKEVFSSQIIKVGQKAKPVNYYFYSEDITDGKLIEVDAKGKTIIISYETDAESMGVYEDVVKYSDKPFEWKGASLANSEMLAADFKDGKIYLTVKPNKTGAKRSTTCGIGNYVEGSETDYLLISFPIEQAAE